MIALDIHGNGSLVEVIEDLRLNNEPMVELHILVIIMDLWTKLETLDLIIDL